MLSINYPSTVEKYPTAAALPAGAPDGDLAVTLDDDTLYISDGTTWLVLAVGGGSSGANTTLSNLTSPTAINQDLIFAKATPLIDSADYIGIGKRTTIGGTTPCVSASLDIRVDNGVGVGDKGLVFSIDENTPIAFLTQTQINGGYVPEAAAGDLILWNAGTNGTGVGRLILALGDSSTPGVGAMILSETAVASLLDFTATGGGFASLSTGARVLFNTVGVGVFDWGNYFLVDSGGAAVSLNWTARTLNGNDGTITAAWTDGGVAVARLAADSLIELSVENQDATGTTSNAQLRVTAQRDTGTGLPFGTATLLFESTDHASQQTQWIMGTGLISGADSGGGHFLVASGPDLTDVMLRITGSGNVTIPQGQLTVAEVIATEDGEIWAGGSFGNFIADAKLMYMNYGGAASSGSGVGIQVTEATLNVGRVLTSSDRASWELKAPATAGVVTITPGAAGFTMSAETVTPRAELYFDTFAGYGATATFRPYYTNVNTTNQGDLTYSNSSTNGLSITIGSAGVYAITVVHGSANTAAEGIAITRNVSANTSADATVGPDRLAWAYQAAAGSGPNVSIAMATRILAPGDVIRFPSQTSSTPASAGYDLVSITKVSG